MNDDKKMFQIGAWSLGIVLLMSIILQVAFRTQDRQISRVRRDIVVTQQKIAVAEASFASYVRPEILRNIVVENTPRAEVVSFNKTVNVADLPVREKL